MRNRGSTVVVVVAAAVAVEVVAEVVRRQVVRAEATAGSMVSSQL